MPAGVVLAAGRGTYLDNRTRLISADSDPRAAHRPNPPSRRSVEVLTNVPTLTKVQSLKGGIA